MSVKVSYEDLQSLLRILDGEDSLAKALDPFLAERKDDYYFYGYEPCDAEYLEIPVSQLGRILSCHCLTLQNGTSATLFGTINLVYQASMLSGQQSVFLYGRSRVQ